MLSPIPSEVAAQSVSLQPKPKQDSNELQVQDMLLLFLLPHIRDAIDRYYARSLKELPLVYPYFVDIVRTNRLNGFRGFILSITLDVVPVVGPHIPVGKDRITFEVSAGPAVKETQYIHLESYELPPHWQDIER